MPKAGEKTETLKDLECLIHCVFYQQRYYVSHATIAKWLVTCLVGNLISKQ